MVSDPTGDFLTRIRNGYLAFRREVKAPDSKMNYSLGKIFIENGFLKKIEKTEEEGKKSLILILKYEKGKTPAVTEIKRISKPGRRVYIGTKEIKPVVSGLGISIISTSAGLMTGKQARKKSLGGELICQAW